MSTSRKICKNDPNYFCNICGEYTFKNCRLSVSEFIKQVYFDYFGFALDTRDKYWVPHMVCKTCVESLRLWANKKRPHFKYQTPMMWREPSNHQDDCYFCVVDINGINKKNRSKWVYPNLLSVTRPVLHSDDAPVPQASSSTQNDHELEGKNSSSSDESETSDFNPDISSQPQPFNQEDLSALVRDLGLSKKASEILASRLKQRNLLTPETRISYYRNREAELLSFFSEDDDFVFCSDVPGLLRAMGVQEYNSNEWRLFIDSSKRSLKCVLMHNGNKLGSIPIAHSTAVKEEYATVAAVMDRIKYKKHKWLICVDLKMVNFLLGQQGGYTKYPCFICLWDSRAKSEHWVRKDWPSRKAMVPGKLNVINKPLVSRDRIILPPLHIKLGLMKQFVKALNRDGDCFKYISKKFHNLSTEKLKAGIFDGPQIRRLIKDENFDSYMTDIEKNAWNEFVWTVQNFLGNKKDENFAEHIELMLSHFQQLGCNMSIKVHFLHSHLHRFPENLGDLSEEQGERFHQDIRTMEERYQGHWDAHMMADYCWSIKNNPREPSQARKSYKRKFFDK